MKTLIVTNMYPSAQLPYSGIFIQNQFNWMGEKLNAEEEEVDLFFMRQILTGKWGSIQKYATTYARFFPLLFRDFQNIHLQYMGWLTPLAVLYKLLHPKTQLIFTFHGGDINDDLPERGLRREFFRWMTRKADVLIAVGKTLNGSIEEKLDRQVDYNLCAGISKKTFYPSLETKKCYDFVFVGSFLPVKGLDILVDAMDDFLALGARFCFVGNGPMEALIASKVQSGQVDILGNLSQAELRDVYNSSHFLAFPSLGDAFGLVVSEAMYCGTPAIVFNKGGSREQVEDGVNGFVASQPSLANWKIAMERAWQTIDTSAYSSLARKASLSNQQFSLDSVCTQSLKIYRGRQEEVETNYQASQLQVI